MGAYKIERYWGDTCAFSISLYSDASQTTPYDLTGYTVVITVNSDEEPTNETNQQFQIRSDDASPQISHNDDGGIITVALSQTNAEIGPDDFYYDLVLIDSIGRDCTAWVDDWKVDYRINQND